MSLSCRPDGTFHILQLTDFHVDADPKLAEQTWRSAVSVAQRERPDFIAFTGDLWCGDSVPEQAPALFDNTCARMAALQTPWAFCWGNHDWYDDLVRRQRQLSQSPRWALTTEDGLGNGRVDIVHEGRVRWDLYFLNSGQHWGEVASMSWLQQEAAALAEARGYVAPMVLFFHIPLGVYERSRLSGAYDGVAGEEVLCWGDEADVLADTIADIGGVRAGYCGHSHLNDFACTHRGIRFAYGRSTGYGGYGDLEKGAKHIILHAGGTIEDATIVPGAVD